MSWSVLQSNSTAQTPAATTFAATYSSNLGSGNVLLAAVSLSGARTISSVKDGANNSFTLIGTVNLNNSSSQGVCALYALATPSGDVGIKPTITATLSSSTVGSIWIAEVSGIQAVTDGSAATAFGAAGACTPTYSDTAASEFFITVFGDNGGPETSSVTGGWTVDSKSINTNADANCVVAYGNSNNGTETNAWTSTGSTTQCGAVAVAFKLSSGGGPTVAQPVIVTAPWHQLPAPPAIPAQIMPVPGNLAPSFTDPGAGVDALTVATALTDSGAGSDSLTVTPWIPQPFTVRLVPPPVPAIPPQLMPLPPVTPVALADAGTGSDALSVAVAFTDSGTGADSLAPAPALADSGTGADTVAVAPQLADSATGADALSTSVTSQPSALVLTPPQPVPAVPHIPPQLAPLAAATSAPSLPDSGAGSDTLTNAVTLADSGTGADTLSVAVQANALTLTPPRPLPAIPPIAPQLVPIAAAVTQAVNLTDSGTGSDALAVTVPTVDSGTGSDSMAVALTAADSGSAADTLAPAMAVSDAGTGTDNTTVGVQLADAASGTDTAGEVVSLTDAGTGSDSLTIAVSFTDSAASADVLVLGAVSVAANDAGTGVDILIVAITLTDTGSGADTLSVPPPGNTGQAKWQAGALSPRWQARPLRPRWTGAAFGPRWKVVLLSAFLPIAAISLQDVNVLWTSDLAGTVIDPTVTPLVVQMAFPISSGNINMPAQPVTWYAASWLAGGTSKGWVAQCLVGPGGTVTLTTGQSYDVWSKIQGSPEIPAMFAGVQQVY